MWFLDSGCSNHMSGIKSLFTELDETKKSEVYLEDDRLIKVERMGTISIKTVQGNSKLLHDVQYALNLAHNLLSLGQVMETGYSLFF